MGKPSGLSSNDGRSLCIGVKCTPVWTTIAVRNPLTCSGNPSQKEFDHPLASLVDGWKNAVVCGSPSTALHRLMVSRTAPAFLDETKQKLHGIPSNFSGLIFDVFYVQRCG